MNKLFLILILFTQVEAQRYLTLDEVDLARREGRWLKVESNEWISLNFTKKYNTNHVKTNTLYTIYSADDPDLNNVHPLKVGYRYHPIYAPMDHYELIVAHRIFLQLPRPMKVVKHYKIVVGDSVLTTLPFEWTYQDSFLNENIKVNQIGYLAEAKKLAHVGAYLGTAGPMLVSRREFEVIDLNNYNTVYTDTLKLAYENHSSTGENIYQADFTAVKSPGWYYLSITGIGTSHPFRIAPDIYNQVLGGVMQGAYHARCGISLDSLYTRFVHGPCHLEDAYIIPLEPLPGWFTGKFGTKPWYPTQLTGKLPVTKGHHDAGDWGKYTVSSANFCGYLLQAYDVIPEKMLQDNLGIPESGNGVPDILEELKWELDFIENMQDTDGGVFCWVKPDKMGYEGVMPDLSIEKRWVYPKETRDTAALAAVLAHAARSKVIQKYYPETQARYLEKAEKAWEWVKDKKELNFSSFGAQEGDQDERNWAVAELFATTRDSTYHNYFLKNHNPGYAHWGWICLPYDYGLATYTYAFLESGADTTMQRRCRDAVKYAAKIAVSRANSTPYRASISADALRWGQWGWLYPSEWIYQCIIANKLNPNPEYLACALDNWNFLLGNNPGGQSHLVGMGYQRFRVSVDDESKFDGIDPPVPGFPIGSATGYYWTQTYDTKLKDNTYPWPPAMQQVYYDGWNVNAEFQVRQLAEDLVAAAYFAMPVENTRPIIQQVTANTQYGPPPLAVQFSAKTTEPVTYFWDFGDDSYAFEPTPSHTFTIPYRNNQVVLTVTDYQGLSSWTKGPVIKTTTTQALFEPYPLPDSTLAYFPDEKGLVLVKSRPDTTNLLWMKVPEGKALRFEGVGSYARTTFPQSIYSDTLVLEAKLYIEAYKGYGIDNVPLFYLSQGDKAFWGFYQDKWDQAKAGKGGIIIGTCVYAGCEGMGRRTLVSSADIGKYIKMRNWHELQLVLAQGKAWVKVDGDSIAGSDSIPTFKNGTFTLTVGNYQGWMDEIRLSRIIRSKYFEPDVAPVDSLQYYRNWVEKLTKLLANENNTVLILQDSLRWYGTALDQLNMDWSNCSAQKDVLADSLLFWQERYINLKKAIENVWTNF